MIIREPISFEQLSTTITGRVARFFLVQYTKVGKYTKMGKIYQTPQNMPSSHKIDQIAV
jgi:hypothetical protein